MGGGGEGAAALAADGGAPERLPIAGPAMALRSGCRMPDGERRPLFAMGGSAPERSPIARLGTLRSGRLAADAPSKPGDDAVRKARFDGFLRFEIGVGCRKLEDALD